MMTEKGNNQFYKKFGYWALWIVCGLVWIMDGSVAFMILPIIYPAITARRS